MREGLGVEARLGMGRARRWVARGARTAWVGMACPGQGMCAGFASGTGNAHRLLNFAEAEVIYLEVGDRSAGDEVHYPDDDLQAISLDGR